MSDHIHQPIVVTHERGARFAAQVRSHRIVVDQPVRAGGDDSAPMPLELLGTALGTCVAYYVHEFLLARSLPTRGLRVEVEQQKATNPSRIGVFLVRVVPPSGLAPGHVELLERVARSCPAHGTLAHGAQVMVTIDTPAEAAA
jgi:uncharacterized OsmC-like protein